MPSYDLEPRYTSNEVPGKCIKCLAEQELDICLRKLLQGEDSREVWHKLQTLVTFLKSPEAQKLRDKAETYLAEGKDVKLSIIFVNGKPRYELKVNE